MSYLDDIERSLADHPNRERWLLAARAEEEVGQALAARLTELGFPAEAEVLEVGCGEGGVAIALAASGRRTTGLEIDAGRLETAGRRAGESGSSAAFVLGSAYQLPFATAAFDVVVLENVIEHLEFWPDAITEASRVLRPGGLLAMTMPNRLGLRTVVADPHWQLFGVVLLPRRAARWVVTGLLKRTDAYDVFEMPSLRRIFAACRRAGLEVARMDDGLYRLRRKADRAGGRRGQLARGLVKSFDGSPRTRALYRLYRRYVSEIWFVEARKSGPKAAAGPTS
jgi:ubiquinone/menaquinone biosynthesis C-methylase UbiE